MPPPSRVPKAVVRVSYKMNSDGTVASHKARVAYPGHRLHANIHYDLRALATYAADRDTDRLLLAVAVTHGLQINHIDLPSAFVQELYTGDEPVLLQPLPNWDSSSRHPGKIAVLERNLYGTPDASRIYADGLYAHLILHGWKRFRADQCLYTRRTTNGLLVLAITIDDFLAASPTAAGYEEIKTMLRRKYIIKDLGPVTKILNWTITRGPNSSLHISQPQLIRDFLHTIDMTSAHSKPTPYASGLRLHPIIEGRDELLPKPNRLLRISGYFATSSIRQDLTSHLLLQHSLVPWSIQLYGTGVRFNTWHDTYALRQIMVCCTRRALVA